MKLIKILSKLNIQFLTKLSNNHIFFKVLASISILAMLAISIWIAGPYLSWGNTLPLAQPEKRIYIIVFLFLMWLLKFLMIDLDTPNPFQYKDPQIRKKLKALQVRFYSALRFLRKTTITRYNKLIRLNQLPWYLLIGPKDAGKTSLLANSTVNFILQRQFPNQTTQSLLPSENCDWWITREACIIDVPGKYLMLPNIVKKNSQNSINYSIFWRFLLRLIKTQRGIL